MGFSISMNSCLMLMIGVIAIALCWRLRLLLRVLGLLRLFLDRFRQRLTQNASWLERDLASCRYIHALTCLGVASTCLRIRMLNGKGTEPARLDTVPFDDRFGQSFISSTGFYASQ